MPFLKPHRLLFACALVAALSGCSGSPDPSFAAFQGSKPAPGMARIVVLYPRHFLTGGDLLNVDIDDVPKCLLGSGHYMVREVEPGAHKLSVGFCGFAPTAAAKVIASAGQTYYVHAVPYDDSLMGKLSGYPRPSQLWEKKQTTSPFEVTLLKEPDALAQMEHMLPAEDR